MHLAALGYPDKPTPLDVTTYEVFFTNFGHILPCKKCTKNYERHIAKLPLINALASRQALFEWTIKLHNIVNREHGKSEWTLDYAREFYLSSSYNECTVDDANILKTDVWRMILILMMIINIVIIIFCVVSIWKF